MKQAVLKLIDIDKSFPGVKALTKAKLNVYPGRVMALMGENGAGKSTLMSVIAGIYSCDSGTVEYQGKPVNFKGPRDSQEAGISIIHQELNLIPNISIAENIFLGREPTGVLGNILWNELYEKANQLLSRLNLNIHSKTLIHELSLGQQQMVEIAKAISFDSKVIIMDEPTDALTDIESSALFNVINELRSQQCAIVYISHRLKEIFKICDDVTVLRDGQWIGEYDIQDIDEKILIRTMVGRDLNEQYPREKIEPGSVCLEAKHLSGSGVHDISFQLKQGEILGVSGLMGSGRTELMKLIYGALPREEGTMKLNDCEIHPKSPQEGLAHGIVYISEDRKNDGLVLSLSVKDNMTLSALHHLTVGLQIHHRRVNKAVDHFIQAFGIKTPHSDYPVGLLSGGNQQKVSIAKGVMTKPIVLILDEPTRGVDVGAKKEIYQLLNNLKTNKISIILVSSDMPEILGISDRILVLHEGRICGEFDARRASQEQLLACAVSDVKSEKRV